MARKVHTRTKRKYGISTHLSGKKEITKKKKKVR